MATERQATITRMRAFARKYRRALATVETLERERLTVYQEARACDPPVTFKEIADTFGITEAAVMQKIKRES
jgi:hypothetical protein